jgi:acetyl-CoA carboxylase carboxyltransferase component
MNLFDFHGANIEQNRLLKVLTAKHFNHTMPFQHPIFTEAEKEANKLTNRQLVNELEERLLEVNAGGGHKAVLKHTQKGKLLVRDRINLLLDRDTAFLELSPLAANGQYHHQFPGAGIVTGIGLVCGRYVMIVANDATVKGGTYIKETIKKHLRAQDIARQNGLPCIYLVDSGGVFLPEQANVFPDKLDFGRIFFNQAQMSAMGLAQIAVVMGSCTAGGAYIPAMSDETIIVRNQGTIFLAGPPLVKAATGETVTDEELGGGDVHTKLSGVADHLADNDQHAIHICRQIVGTLPKPQTIDNRQLTNTSRSEDIYQWLPPAGQPFPDVRNIIKTLVDDSQLNEFKAEYGTTLVTGFAKINGHQVGILANNGILFSESALKGAHFIQLCNHRHIPMVFLQNITGFMVGKEYEHRGIAKDGAKMVNALANSKVPFVTIIIGGSYGAGNYAMGGRAYDPRFLFMWPNARISVMGAKQAGDVLVTLKKEQDKKGDSRDIREIDRIREEINTKYEHEGSPWYSTSRLWDDGVIDPANTRPILALILDLFKNSTTQPNEQQYGIFRM